MEKLGFVITKQKSYVVRIDYLKHQHSFDQSIIINSHSFIKFGFVIIKFLSNFSFMGTLPFRTHYCLTKDSYCLI